MTGPAPIAPTPPGSWRLVEPSADVTSAVDAVRSACSGWKPVFVDVPTVGMGTREEGICNAVRDWSSWSMDRSSLELLAGFAAGVLAGLLLYLFLAVTVRKLGSILGWLIPRIADRIQQVTWSTRRSFERQRR